MQPGVGCWAHGRRRFREALETDPRAASMLALVQELYRVEREAEALSPEERWAQRQKCSVPVLARIDGLRLKLEAEVLPKSPLGEALRYLGNQWTALNRFVLDGRLRPDNNGAHAASGMSPGMPRARLCRVGKTGRRDHTVSRPQR